MPMTHGPLVMLPTTAAVPVAGSNVYKIEAPQFTEDEANIVPVDGSNAIPVQKCPGTGMLVPSAVRTPVVVIEE